MTNLDDCAREPIHIPGAIQEHGILIAIDPDSFEIIQVSENVGNIISYKPAEVIGKKITGLISKEFDKFLSNCLKPGTSDCLTTFNANINNQNFTVITHLSDDLLILEFEPRTDEIETNKIQRQLNDFLSVIHHSKEFDDITKNITHQIKEITGYDRVMLYKFHPDWHGEVIAEAKEKNVPGYYGLHFPATDIPEQARNLYFKNEIRMICDVNSTPSPLYPQTVPGLHRPIDLSYCISRAVSPIHIQYLKKMDVQASLSIAIITKNKLWGIVACHHSTPKFLSHNLRNTCRIIGRIFSLTLESKMDNYDEEKFRKLDEARERLFGDMLRKDNIAEALFHEKSTILDMNSAHGACMVFDNKMYAIGNTPPEKDIVLLADWMKDNISDDVFYLNNLSQIYPAAKEFTDVGSGILAIAVNKSNGEYIFWFKPERIKEVFWSGNPDKSAETDDNNSLPINLRKSFAKWKEEVHNNAEQWSNAELMVARKFQRNVAEALNQKALQLRKLNEHLKEAYDELDAFSYTISHDLKTPLTTIRSFSEILLDDHFKDADPEAKMILGRIIKGVDKMDNLIYNVLNYSKIGREGKAFKIVNTKELLYEIKEEAIQRYSDQDVQIKIIDELPVIKGEPTMIRQLFTNIVMNAIKYSKTRDQSILIIKSRKDDGTITFMFEDNGIGIDKKHEKAVFDLFKKFTDSKEYEGNGVGLAIAKRIAHVHKGDLTFKSELNKGTTFYFTIPAHNTTGDSK